MQRERENSGSAGRLSFSSSFWLVLATLVLGGASLAYPWTLMDSPLSTYIGSILVEGGALYRDVWDPRAPGIFFAHAFQVFLFGKSAVGLRALDLLWQFATTLALASIGARLYGRPTIGLAAGISYLATYYSQNYWTWAEPDTFLSLPLALAVLCVFRGLESQKTVDWFAAAVCVGIATLFKLPYGLSGVLLLGIATHRLLSDPRNLIRCFVGLAAGFAAPLLACGLYLHAKSALGDALVSQFVFAPAYAAQVRKVVGLGDFNQSLLRPGLVLPAVMAVVGLGIWIVRLRRHDKPDVEESVLVGWFVVGLICIFLHGSFLPYHYISLFAPVAVLFAGGLNQVIVDWQAQRNWRGGVILLFVVLSLVGPAEKLRQHIGFARRVMHGFVLDAPLRELGEYINERTGADETIFVWGNAPVVYLHAQRRAASRFLCTAYLSVDIAEFDVRALVLRELETKAPTYFVLFRNGAITPGLPDSLTSFEAFPALKALLAADYEVEVESKLCTLYRRKRHR